MNSFTDLLAWQEGYKFSREIYAATITFPRNESFGLTSQLRRAAISITSNIAEGFGRTSLLEKIRFNQISLSSLYEIQSQLLISKDLNYIDPLVYQALHQQSVELAKIIQGLNRSLKRLLATNT